MSEAWETNSWLKLCRSEIDQGMRDVADVANKYAVNPCESGTMAWSRGGFLFHSHLHRSLSTTTSSKDKVLLVEHADLLNDPCPKKEKFQGHGTSWFSELLNHYTDQNTNICKYIWAFSLIDQQILTVGKHKDHLVSRTIKYHLAVVQHHSRSLRVLSLHH